MNAKLIFVLGCVFLYTNLNAQIDAFKPTPEELVELNRELKADTNLAKFIGWHGDVETLYHKFKQNIHIADSIWNHDQKNLSFMDIGETEKLEIIPLIDWFTANDELIGENGTSYLIRTDDATIIFDLGLNAKGNHPSPLLQNMEKFGVSIDEIDMIVLSHNHPDHIGGRKWFQDNTFSFTGHQFELNNLKVYTANEMKYPGLEPTHTPKPTKIAKGVATIGVINNPIFLNAIAEQALAINVKGKGIVIISGCGHQSLEKIMTRTNVLFQEPVYGVFGGFHFPMEENRNITWVYKYFVVDKMPWERLTEEDINYNINVLKKNGVEWVAISGHDSCDKSLGLFEKAFGDQYQEIVVGKKVTF